MEVRSYGQGEDNPVLAITPDVTRVEIPVPATNLTGANFKVVILDADDTFDVIIERDTADQTVPMYRECVWSIVKDIEAAVREREDTNDRPDPHSEVAKDDTP